MENLIEAKNLVKHYGEVKALDGIDFHVVQGEIFGFLGPNGAGKTTTINILTGLARPGNGLLSYRGLDYLKNMKSIQSRIGIVPDESNLYEELTGFANLCFCGALYGVNKKQREKKAATLLDLFQMGEAARRRYKTYSKGMKRKLTVAAALMHDPELLFLDEPTTGIDVASARTIREMIKGLNAAGTTVFLTTHYIEEAERLCRRISFIKEGRIIRTAPVSELLAGAEDETVIEIAVDEPLAAGDELGAAIRNALPEAGVEIIDERAIRLRSKKKIDITESIALFAARRIAVREARLVKKSLEDVFVEVTGLAATVMKKEKEKK